VEIACAGRRVAFPLPLSVGDNWSLRPTYWRGMESSGTPMAMPRSRLRSTMMSPRDWRDGHHAGGRGSCRELPPIDTPDVPYPPALMEGDKWCLLQKTIILAPSHQYGCSCNTARYHSLANIRRVFWECQCNGFRSDGAVENLGLIREPTDGELVQVDIDRRKPRTSGRPESGILL